METNNQVTKKTMFHINIEAIDYKVTRRKLHGKEYMIIPVTMMVEGVHRGNHGAVFHSISELGKIPQVWNGIPIVVNHPEKDGLAVSANSPEVLEEFEVGKVFNTTVEDMKLKAFAWIEDLRLQEISPEAYEQINEGKPVEVSVGVFTDNDEQEGEWNGETYVAVAKNHRPDHLAILPNAKGACSLEDGCGLGINQAQYLDLRKKGFRIETIGDYAKTGYKEKMDAVYGALRDKDKEGVYHYLEEMYDDSLIFSKSTKSGTTMYKQGYSFESGKIELSGNPVEVHRKVEYVTNLSINNFKKEDTMSKNECPKCAEKVNALILNKESGFAEGDREWLSTLTEPQLDKVAPKVIEKVVEKTVEVEVNKLTDAQKAALAYGEKQLKERREKMIKGIQANTDKVWADEKLAKMDEETLESIYKSVVREEITDYSLSGGGQNLQDNVGEVEPMLSGGMSDEPKK